LNLLTREAVASLLFLLCLINVIRLPFCQAASFVVKVRPNEEQCVMIRTGSFDASRPRFLEGGFEVIDDYSTESILVILMDDKDHAVFQRSNERQDYFFVENVAPNTHYWLCLQSHPPPDATDEGATRERTIGFEFDLVFDEDELPTLPPRPGPVQVEPYSKVWIQKVRYCPPGSLLWRKFVPACEQRVDIACCDRRFLPMWTPEPRLTSFVALRRCPGRVHRQAMAVHKNLKNIENHHSYMHVRELEHRTVTERTFSDILFWTVLEVSLVCFLVR
jgi:hypothetical protein